MKRIALFAAILAVTAMGISCSKKDAAPTAPPAAPPANTATFTISPTVTVTPTASLSPTPSSTPTITGTPTPTSTNTPLVTPTPYDTPSCGSSAVTLGSAALNVSAPQIANVIHCTRYTLAAPATILTMTLNVQSPGAALSVRMGIYDEAAGKPANLLADTGLVNCMLGWDTFPLTSAVTLAAGNYWLAASVVPTGTSYLGEGSAGYVNANFTAAPPGDLPNPAGGPATVASVYALSMYALGCPSASTPTSTPTVNATLVATQCAWTGYQVTPTGCMGTSPGVSYQLTEKITFATSVTLRYLTASVIYNDPDSDLQIGLYDDSSGNPNNLLCSTGHFKPAEGLNVSAVTSPVTLAAGSYWISILTYDGVGGGSTYWDDGTNCVELEDSGDNSFSRFFAWAGFTSDLPSPHGVGTPIKWKFSFGAYSCP